MFAVAVSTRFYFRQPRHPPRIARATPQPDEAPRIASFQPFQKRRTLAFATEPGYTVGKPGKIPIASENRVGRL